MKLFDDVSPVQLKCPCGEITPGRENANKEVWRTVNSDNDAIFLHLSCHHNPLLSQCILMDKDGNVIRKMNKEKLGPKRYYILVAYKKMLDLKDAISNFLWETKRVIFSC